MSKTEIQSYEDYCALFSSSDTALLGAQLSLVQSLIIALDRQDKRGLTWDSLELEHLESMDFFSELLEETLSACVKITGRPQEKLLRNYALVPPYRGKEMDAYCINWLSRQRGRSKKEKMACLKSIKTVKRERSLDTGENRLFLAFLKEEERILRRHVHQLPNQRPSFGEVRKLVTRVQMDEKWQEVKDWTHLPPNNTLLSHPSYSVVWKAWLLLRRLGSIYQELQEQLDQYLLLAVETSILYYLRQNYFCPQDSLGFSREHGEISSLFFALDEERSVLSLKREVDCLLLESGNMKLNISVSHGSLSVTGQKKPFLEVFQPEKLLDYGKDLVDALSLTKASFPDLRAVEEVREPSKHLMVDLLSLHPHILERGQHSRLTQRLLSQGELSCSQSNALRLEESHCILSSFGKHRESMRGLLTETAKYLPSRSLTVLSPDGIDEFQKREFQKVLGEQYENLEFFPSSLGIVFQFLLSTQKDKDKEDFPFVVVDLLGNQLTFTLLKPYYEEKFLRKWDVKYLDEYVSKWGGLVLERHPTITIPLSSHPWEDILPEALKPLLENLGMEGLLALTSVPLWTEEGEHLELTPELAENLKKTSLDLGEYWKEYQRIQELHGNQILDTQVHLLTSSSFLKMPALKKCSKEKQLEGCQNFQLMEQRLDKIPFGKDLSFWKDKLPQLTLLIGGKDYPLVGEDLKITPKLGSSVEIPMEYKVILPAGTDKWRFDVKKEDSVAVYKAEVIRPPASSMTEDLTCSLKMSYAYGDVEPYKLEFYTDTFSMAVHWVEGEYDWENLDYPPFLHTKSVEDLQREAKNLRRRDPLMVLEEKWCILHKIDEFHRVEALEAENYRFTYMVDNQEINWPFQQNHIEFAISKKERETNQNWKKTLLGAYLVPAEVITTRYVSWKEGRSGNGPYFMAFPMVESAGRKREVALFSHQFLLPENFEEMRADMRDRVYGFLSFSVEAPNQMGKSPSGKYIHYTRDEPIRKRLVPIPVEYWKRDLLTPLHSLVIRGTWIETLPEQTQNAVLENIAQLFPLYEETKSTDIFHVMCLLYHALNEEQAEAFYQSCLTFLKNGNNRIPERVGLALGQLEREQQRTLLVTLLSEPKLTTDIKVQILSRGIWGNENFFKACFEANLAECLFPFLDTAVKSLGMIDYKKQNNAYKIRVIARYLECLLGLLRLREGIVTAREEQLITQEQAQTMARHLSLNHKTMLKLKNIIEDMVKYLPKWVEEQNFKRFTMIQFNKRERNHSMEGEVREFLENFLLYLMGTSVGEIQIFMEEE